MAKTDTGTAQTSIDIFKTSGAVSIKGCKVTINFLPESNGKTIDTVKKMLISSIPKQKCLCYTKFQPIKRGVTNEKPTTPRKSEM